MSLYIHIIDLQDTEKLYSFDGFQNVVQDISFDIRSYNVTKNAISN